jgi:hypothetical protein
MATIQYFLSIVFIFLSIKIIHSQVAFEHLCSTEAAVTGYYLLYEIKYSIGEL